MFSFVSSRGSALMAALVAACSPAPAVERPNIVLISIDSLRADHLSCYDYERETSPTIDRLAAEGVLFESFISSTSWTLPAHAAMFTGLPDSVHGCDRNARVLAPERDTLAERLKQAGYSTAGFWSGPYLHPIFGLAQGFDEYVRCTSYRVFREAEIEAWGSQPEGAAPRGQNRAHHRSHEDVTNPRISESVEAWFTTRDESDADEPFFLFVHMWDVHYDYIPPPPYDTLFDPDYSGPVDGRDLGNNKKLQSEGLSPRDLEHLIALYDGEIAWTDHHVGRIMAALEERGLADDTLVVVTSDHGEEFFEHGLFGHRKALFEESVRIPLVMRLPDRVPAGIRVDALARMVDLAPTLLEYAGVEALPDTLGSSLVPFIEDPDRPAGASRVAISELVRQKRGDTLLAVRSTHWKTLVVRETGETLGLWHLRVDPDEQKDLTASGHSLEDEARQTLKRTTELLDRLGAGHAVDSAAQEGALPPEIEAQLKGLGYIGDD